MPAVLLVQAAAEVAEKYAKRWEDAADSMHRNVEFCGSVRPEVLATATTAAVPSYSVVPCHWDFVKVQGNVEGDEYWRL